MTTIDDRIRGALSADDQAFLEGLDQEPGMFAQAGDMFRGSMARWTVLVYVMAIVFAALGAWAIMRMFAAPDLREQLLWMTGVIWCALVIAMIKLWAWGRMQRLGILRELKRIEVRIAQIERR